MRGCIHRRRRFPIVIAESGIHREKMSVNDLPKIKRDSGRHS